MKILWSGVEKRFDGKRVMQPTDLCIKSGCFTTLLSSHEGKGSICRLKKAEAPPKVRQ